MLYVYTQVREHFLPPLLDAILGDYYRNVPQAREPEVLSTVTAIVDKLEVREGEEGGGGGGGRDGESARGGGREAERERESEREPEEMLFIFFLCCSSSPKLLRTSLQLWRHYSNARLK